MPGADVLVIVGPTAVGKSQVGLHLAQILTGEIVSADSMQVYKLMDIGTAKPTPEEQKLVRHHLIDVVYPWEKFSVARYQELADRAIQDILHRGRTPIVVGGTGLYVTALLDGFLFPTRATPKPGADWRRCPNQSPAVIPAAPGGGSRGRGKDSPTEFASGHPGLGGLLRHQKPISLHQGKPKGKPRASGVVFRVDYAPISFTNGSTDG